MAKVILLETAVPANVTGPITTTGAAPAFSIQPRQNNEDRTLALSAIGVVAEPTTLTVDLECSVDNGTTWQKYKTAIALVATAVGTVAVILNVVAGLLYRINATTVTLGGSSTSVAVWATLC